MLMARRSLTASRVRLVADGEGSQSGHKFGLPIIQMHPGVFKNRSINGGTWHRRYFPTFALGLVPCVSDGVYAPALTGRLLEFVMPATITLPAESTAMADGVVEITGGLRLAG